MKTFITQEAFLEKAKAKHGNTYDYSLVKYKRSSEKVIIICKKHGEFTQIANSHTLGYGCSKCGFDKISKERLKDSNIFIKECLKLHNDKYDYSITKCKGVRKKIKIICKEHGIFIKMPSDHLNGQGCPRCVTDTFNKKFFIDKKAFFYFIKCSSLNEEFYKIGITSKDVNYRFKKFPYNVDIIEIIENTGEYVWSLESKLKKDLYNYRYKPQIDFHGYTECFTCKRDIIKRLLNKYNEQ